MRFLFTLLQRLQNSRPLLFFSSVSLSRWCRLIISRLNSAEWLLLCRRGCCGSAWRSLSGDGRQQPGCSADGFTLCCCLSTNNRKQTQKRRQRPGKTSVWIPEAPFLTWLARLRGVFISRNTRLLIVCGFTLLKMRKQKPKKLMEQVSAAPGSSCCSGLLSSECGLTAPGSVFTVNPVGKPGKSGPGGGGDGVRWGGCWSEEASPPSW